MTSGSPRATLAGLSYGRAFVLAAIAVGVGCAAFLLWQLTDILLLAVGALLVAALLHLVAEPFHRWTPLPVWAALIISGLIVLGIVGVTGWIFGHSITSEFSEALKRAESGLTQVQNDLGTSEIGRVILKQARDTNVSVTAMLNRVLLLGTSIVEAVIVLFISALYLAVQPELYRDGIVLLFPPRHHAKARETLDDLGRALRLWLLGQLIQMVIIGALSTLAVWLVGLPSPLALGLIATIAEFVPYLGPIIAAIPALLIAVTQDPSAVIWTLVAYLAIHQIEGNLVAPLIQRRLIFIPPALMLLGIAAIGALFGLPGFLFAAPVVMLVFVAVKKLYVRETLHEPTELPGEDTETHEAA